MGRRGGDDFPEKPDCFSVEQFFSLDSPICKKCPYLVPCAVSLGKEISASRKVLEKNMAMRGVPLKDAVKAIRTLFPDVTKNAVQLSYSRKLRKYLDD